MSKVIAMAIDVEVTSFDKIGGDMISTGLVEILDGYKLGREKVFYSKPDSVKYFTDAAVEIHGISLFKALTFPERKKTCNDIINWLNIETGKVPLVYHANGNFDPAWLYMHYQKENIIELFNKFFYLDKNKNISTLKLAKKNIVHLENYKLSTVAKHYDLDLDHHEALSDARVCGQIYCNIMLKKDIWTGELDL